MSRCIASRCHHKARRLRSLCLNYFDRFEREQRSHTMAMQNIPPARRVDLLERKGCTFPDGSGGFLVRSPASPWQLHWDNASDIARKAINVKTKARCTGAPIWKQKYAVHGWHLRCFPKI